MNKLLTIVVPSYNMEKYLPKCLGSMVVHDSDSDLLQRLEVIVVNDGSKDRTSEIAHGFESRYPGVFRVIDKPNGNYGSCMNAALPVASGLYIKVVDADDYVDTDCLAGLLAALDEESSKGGKGADVVISDFDVVDEHDKVTDRVNYDLPGSCHALDAVPESTRRFETQAVTYRTEIPRRISYRQSEGISYTDVEWVMIPMSSVTSLRYVKLPVVKYLLGRDGQTMTIPTYMSKYESVVCIFMRIMEWYRNHVDILSPSAYGYCRRMLSRSAENAYHARLIGIDNIRADFDIRRFDIFLQSDPELYQEMDSLSWHIFKHDFRFVRLSRDKTLVGRLVWVLFVLLRFAYQQIYIPVRKLV